MPRTRRLVSACAVVAAAVLATACAPRESPPERIFLFVVDTLRRDHVGLYADAASTPSIDRLAEGGQVFTNASASFHQTTMSMGSLFSGETPSIELGDGRSLPWTSETWCGMSRFSSPEDRSCVPGRLTTLAERLRAAGYATLGFATNALMFDPAGFSQGFDEWVEIDAANRIAIGRAPLLQRAVLERLEDLEAKRFFLYVHWMDVHQYGYDLSNYAPAVEAFDAAFGDFLDELEARGLFEDSLLVFTSDHGESLGEKTAVRMSRHHFGNPSFESVLRIPLIARPGLGRNPAAPIRSQDIGRMILRAAGADLAASDAMLDPDELFIGEASFATYRRGRFKSMRARRESPTYLFDLERDPGETRDVAAAHPDVVAAHDARVAELVDELGSSNAAGARIDEADRKALRALGYLD